MSIAKIYMLSSPNTDKVYIGSTVDTLNSRLSKHKYDFTSNRQKGSCRALEIFDAGDVEISELEEVKYETKEDYLLVENKWIAHYKETAVNHYSAIGRDNEKIRISHTKASRKYIEKNKEKLKKNYEKNKKKYQTIIECACGRKYTRWNEKKHLKTPMHQKFLIDGIVNVQKNESIICPCGGKYINRTEAKTRHEKSIKHQKYIANQ